VKRTAAQKEFRFFTADDWEWLGGMYVRAKELRAGEECFRQALLLDPGCLDYYLTLSDVLRYQARNEESLAMLDALAARAPEHFGLRHKRGQVYMQMGQTQKARALFLAEPKDSPHWQAAREHLARLEES
jgi:predicted Zn-dependent protease